jgi:hypothetical protein
MRQQASLPLTGPRAGSHAEGEALKRQAQALLDARNAAKRSAALKPAGIDTSRANVERARREGWRDGSLRRQHGPG